MARVIRIPAAEIMAGMHDYDTTGRKAKCRHCGRLAIEVMNSRSPACKGRVSPHDPPRDR
jgi:hypothetical protein